MIIHFIKITSDVIIGLRAQILPLATDIASCFAWGDRLTLSLWQCLPNTSVSKHSIPWEARSSLCCSNNRTSAFFLRRTPILVWHQQKCLTCNSHFSTQKMEKRYILKGQYLIKFIICTASSRVFLSEIGSWQKYFKVGSEAYDECKTVWYCYLDHIGVQFYLPLLLHY